MASAPSVGLAFTNRPKRALRVGLELGRDLALLELELRSALLVVHPEGWNDALLDVAGAFYATVRAARDGRESVSSLATSADGRRVVELVDALVDSHGRRAWVSVRRPLEVGA